MKELHWSSKSLKDLAKIIVSPVDKKVNKKEEKVLLCNYMDVYYNRIIDRNINFMKVTATKDEIKRFGLNIGDVIITKDSEDPKDIGIPAIVEEKINNLVCGYHLAILRPNEEVDSRFLAYAISNPRIRYDLYRYANGITRFGLTKDSYSKVTIDVPTITEQKKISLILSTWDQNSENIEILIEKKKQRYSSLIQRYINYECEKWNHIKVREIFKSYTRKKHGGEELLSVTQDRGVIPRSHLEGRVMSPDGSTNGYKLVESGDFVISLRSFQGGIEYSEYRGIVSPAYTVLKNKIPINKEFYKHFFKSRIFIKKYLRIAIIGIRDGKQVSFPDFESVKIPYPPIEEQEKIAVLLSVAKQEIELLKKLRDAYIIQKKGLMQKLLTGMWRVKI